MLTQAQKIQKGRDKQKVRDEAIHRWYRFVLAYPDHLIRFVLDRIDASSDSLILDPFCGTGTTLVECKKLGLDSIGIDANPSSVFASRVKCNWQLDPDVVHRLSEELLARVQYVSDTLLLSDTPMFASVGRDEIASIKRQLVDGSPEAQYLLKSGMIARKWIDEIPFYISIALLTQISHLQASTSYQDLFRLALAAVMVESVANIRFGPELYVVKGSGSHDVIGAFRQKVKVMIEDLQEFHDSQARGETRVFHGDARVCDQVLAAHDIFQVDHLITSPPYPTEKDYTRNTRLELVYLGFVRDSASLRKIKKQMVRSHSKGIYKEDGDGCLVADMPEIRAISDELGEKIKGKTYGFAKLYPRIIEEYFGGMYRHFQSLAKVIRSGGRAAYVVGEQCTYLQTFTPTGTILAKIAERPELGFRVHDVLTWRVRQGTTGSRDTLKEEIVIIEKK